VSRDLELEKTVGGELKEHLGEASIEVHDSATETYSVDGSRISVVDVFLGCGDSKVMLS
jgi:hypothetical protein